MSIEEAVRKYTRAKSDHWLTFFLGEEILSSMKMLLYICK